MNARNHLPGDTSLHVRLRSSATPLENVKCRVIQCRLFGTGSLVVVVAAVVIEVIIIIIIVIEVVVIVLVVVVVVAAAAAEAVL